VFFLGSIKPYKARYYTPQKTDELKALAQLVWENVPTKSFSFPWIENLNSKRRSFPRSVRESPLESMSDNDPLPTLENTPEEEPERSKNQCCSSFLRFLRENSPTFCGILIITLIVCAGLWKLIP